MRRIQRFPFAALMALTLACAGDGAITATEPNDPNDPGPWDKYRSPVGTFTLKTVNGVDVPMLWEELEPVKGFKLRSYWLGGKIEFRPDSTFTLSMQHRLTGPGLPGTPKSDGFGGTWRLAPDAKIEVRATGGGLNYWQTTDIIYSVTVKSAAPDLKGNMEPVIFVFVRD